MKINLYDLFGTHNTQNDGVVLTENSAGLSARNITAAVFAQITPEKKAVAVRPRCAIRKVIAASLAAVVLIAASIPVYAYIAAPAYLSSYFGGDVALLNGLYSPGETVLETDSADISIKTVGMVGDNSRATMILKAEALGDFVFDKNKKYFPVDWVCKPTDSLINNLTIGAYSMGMDFSVTDEKTLTISIVFSTGVSGALAGKTIEIFFNDFNVSESYTDTNGTERSRVMETVHGNWMGRVKLDYPNTTVKLAAKEALELPGVTCEYKKASVSNLGFNCSLRFKETESGAMREYTAQHRDGTNEFEYVRKITLVFSDSTEKEYSVSTVPTERGDSILFNSVGNSVQDDGTVNECTYSFTFPQVIDTANISEVYINGISAFIKR